MQTNTVAADVVAVLAAAPQRWHSVHELAQRCNRPIAEVREACDLLHRYGFVQLDADGTRAGSVQLGPNRAAAQRAILVVENTPAVAHVVGALLESEGYKVLIAGTPSTAVPVVQAVPVSLVVADSFAGTGRQALERLAALRDAAGSTPILIFTAHRDLDEEAARAAGFAGLLPKPFDIDELLARVAEVLGTARAG